VTRHLLVTNDFPPKVGGIQNYLWDLWSRLDPSSFVVLTASSDPKAAGFDEVQAVRGVHIERVAGSILYFPTAAALGAVRRCVAEHAVDLVLFDPVLPLGLIGRQLDVPYGVLIHGAEVTVPARLPIARAALAHVLEGASIVVAAGGYPVAQIRRAADGISAPVIEIPPGVDASAITPLGAGARRSSRVRLGLSRRGPLVVSLSRLVPRKGMDVLIEAARRLAPSYPDLVVAIGGEGRELAHLQQLAAVSPVTVKILGRVSDEDRAGLLGAADVFVMACHDRWFGLEQEGFGIVFLEAAAAGVPQIAGNSGGAPEAVIDGVTGFVVDAPRDAGAVAEAIRAVLADPMQRRRMGRAARTRVQESFDNDVLASRLADALVTVA
jgi:phosphatidylinositol alpha-1,6-mannosyltransferase